MSSTLTVCLLTYDRFDYAERTLRSFFKHVNHDGPLSVHIADDGSPEGYIADLMDVVIEYREHGIVTGDISTSNSERGGYGKNYNLAAQSIHARTDYVLPLEDDWELVRDFDTRFYCKAATLWGCVRLGYLGYTQDIRGTVKRCEDHNVLVLDPDSPEPHVFAGHPRITTVTWERNVGEWPEGELPGQTEYLVSKRDAARHGVVWPMDHIRSCGDLFTHIGTLRSY